MSDTEIQGLSFEIDADIKDASKSIDALSNSFQRLKKSLSGASGLDKVSKQLESLNKSLDVINSDKIAGLADAIGTLKGTKVPSNIAKNIKEIGTALDSFTLSDVQKVEELANALAKMDGLKIPNIGKAMESVNGASEADEEAPSNEPSDSGVQERRNLMQAALETAKLEFSTTKLGMVLSSVGEVGSKVGAIIKNAFKLAHVTVSVFVSVIRNLLGLFKKLASVVMKVGSAIKTGFAKAFPTITDMRNKLGQLGSSMARIMMYRGIRSLFSGLTAAMREGINNLYQYSNLMGGTFASSLDRMATSAQYLKNSLGAMVSPLITAVAPAVDYIIDKFVALLNVINQVFARLTGASFFTKAKKAATSFGTAAAGAASNAGKAAKKAAKDIKDATIGIDELNIIRQNDDTGSGGGGGAGGGGGGGLGNYADMFETVPIDNGIADFVDKFKEALNAGDWESAGRMLGGKLNELVDMIDYGAIGHKLGYYFNGGIQTLYYTLDEIDWVGIGNHVAELLNGAFEEIDFSYLGRLLVKKFTIKLDWWIGFLGGLDWGLVGKSIGDFFIGAFKEATEWISKYDWGEMAKKLYKNVKEMIKGIDFASVAQEFFKLLGTALGSAALFIGSFIEEVVNDIGEYFQQYVKNDDGTYKAGLDLIKGVFKGITDAIAGIATWIHDNIFSPFIESFKTSFGIHSPSTVMAEMGGYIVDGFLEGLKDFLNIGETIKGYASSVIEFFIKGKDGKGIVENFKELGGNIVSGFSEKFSSSSTTATKTNVTAWSSDVKKYFTNSNYGGVNKTTFSKYASDAVGGFNEKIGSAGSSGTRANMTTWGLSVNSGFSQTASKTAFSGFASDIVTSFKSKVSSAYSTSKTIMTTWGTNVKKWFSDMVSKNAFSTIASSMVTAFSSGVSGNYSTSKSPMITWGSSVISWFNKPTGGDTLTTSFTNIGKNIIQGFINGVNSLWKSAMDRIKEFGRTVIAKGKEGTQERSPSRAFKEIGAFVIEGFNIGLEDMMPESYRLMNKWTNGLMANAPALALAVDTGALDYYNSDRFARSVESNIHTGSFVGVTGFKDALEDFYHAYVEPTMLQMADDVKRQADKEEQTVVQIGGRTITDAVETQQKANGYRFTK